MDYIKLINNKIKQIETQERICVLFNNLSADTNIYAYKENDVIVSASIIKVPIMLAILDFILHNNISLDTIIKIYSDDILYDNRCFNNKYQFSIEELLTWMITLSDNSSTNVLIKYLGFDKINDYFKQIELFDTRLERYMLDDIATKNGRNNYTSLNDIYKCFKYIIDKQILNDTYCELALNILYKQKSNNQINRYLNIKFAHKTGELDYLNSDTGIFVLNNETYFIGISTYNTPSIYGDKVNVGKLGKLFYKYIKNN